MAKDTDEFIRENVPRGTSEVPRLTPEGQLIDEREEIRSESQRMLNRLQSQPSKLPPGIRRTVAATREQGKESMFPAAAPARDLLSGILGASPTAPGSEAYRTGQAIANMPPVQAAAAIPAKIAASAGDAATALAAMGPAMGAVVKRKGGNWIRNQPEKLLRRLKNQPDGLDEDIVMTQERLAALENVPFNVETQRRELRQELAGYKTEKSLNNWIDTKLGKYIKNEMGTPEDPLRKLAERGVLHIDPDRDYPYSTLTIRRRNEGFPEEGVAQSDLAKLWENIADEEIDIEKQKFFVQHAEETNFPATRRFMANNPWVKDLDPETSLYSMSVLWSQDRPGFRHLIDELRNASNPQSGLPRELQIDPQKLDRVSVPQAVELVDKINKWRMDNIKNLQLEETLKADLYKVYPEKNYRWVQLNRPGQFAAESDAMGHSVRGYEPPGKGGDMYYGVGGYEAIQSGDARVYSLRDEKGQPHVTIEVEANLQPYPVSGEAFAMLDPQTKAQYRQYVMEWRRRNPEIKELTDDDVAQALREAGVPPMGDIILQIKGKGNAMPVKKYLPFVQDFVKSGNWSQVNDLQNTGLIKIDPASDLAAKFKSEGKPVPPYVSQDELTNLLKWHRGEGDLPEGFKNGGPVNVSRGTSTSKQQLDKLAQVSKRKKA